MTDKQETMLINDMQKVIDRLKRTNKYVTYDTYDIIKLAQECMNKYLDELIQCDE